MADSDPLLPHRPEPGRSAQTSRRTSPAAAAAAAGGASVNITHRLRVMAATYPDKPAVIVRARAKWPGERITFAELDRDSDAAARGMAGAGIGRGMKTLIMLRPSVAFFSCFFGLFKLGAVPVFIDPGMGGRRLLECVRLLEPGAMVGVPLAHFVRILFRKNFPGLKVAITQGRRWLWGGHRWDRLKRRDPTPFPIAQTAADDLAAILFTTGSTGPAKGVEYSHAALDRQIDLLADLFHIGPDDCDAATFPGFSLFSVALGMTAVIPDMDPVHPGNADPEKILAAIGEEGCTFSFGSPALWGKVSRYAAAKGRKLPSLVKVVMAGAPVPAETHGQLLESGVMDKQAGVTFTPYGATEVMPVSCITGQEVLAETAAATARGDGFCIGRPVSGARVEIIRITDGPIETWDDSLLLPEGRIGEIVVQAAHASRHYHNLPAADALAKIADGGDFWHRMGDVGYKDPGGRIWFCGRKAHRVRTPEGDLFSVCCEAIFNQHPNVSRSALVGVPLSPAELVSKQAARQAGDASTKKSSRRIPGKTAWQTVDENARRKAALSSDPAAGQAALQATGAGPFEAASGSGQPLSGFCRPVIVIQLHPEVRRDREELLGELRNLGASSPLTSAIDIILFHDAFPTDIRHNAKIRREDLAAWARLKVPPR